MQLGRKGRTEISYSTLIIAIIVFLGAAAVLYFLSTSTGQVPFLDPNVVGWPIVIMVWIIGPALAGLFVVIIQKLRD